MKVAFIEPLVHLKDYSVTKMHMVLPEMMWNPEYLNHYMGVEGHKILDNGAAEGDQISWADLIRQAHMVGADEIVVPDVMGNSTETQRMAINFSTWLNTEGIDRSAFQWMGVAHGNSLAEVVSCIHVLASLDYITVLGLPRILANNIHKHIRCNILESNLMDDVIKEGFPDGIHCLGASRWPKEAIILADYPVRSIDTSVVASMSLHGRDIGQDDWCARPDNFWSRVYGSQALADSNHMKYLEWCVGTQS